MQTPRHILAATILAATATPALAEGGNVPPPPPPVVIEDEAHDWSGPYVGLGFGQFEQSNEVDGPTTVVFIPSEETVNVGLYAGYAWQSGSFVYGAELAHISFRSESFISDADITETEARLRAGMAFDDLLVSGILGLSHLAAEGSFGSATQDGHVVGIGVAYAVSDSLSLGLDATRTTIVDDIDPTTTITSYIDRVMLRLGFHF